VEETLGRIIGLDDRPLIEPRPPKSDWLAAVATRLCCSALWRVTRASLREPVWDLPPASPSWGLISIQTTNQPGFGMQTRVVGGQTGS
jgi:hypothetical protein